MQSHYQNLVGFHTVIHGWYVVLCFVQISFRSVHNGSRRCASRLGACQTLYHKVIRGKGYRELIRIPLDEQFGLALETLVPFSS